MRIKIITKPKVILVSLIILISASLHAQNNEGEIYELINEILSEYESGTIDSKFRVWRKDYFSSLDPNSYITIGSTKFDYSLDLDSVFNVSQKAQITEQLRLNHSGNGPRNMNQRMVRSKVSLKKNKSSHGSSVTQLTYPIISEGINGCMYAIIEVSTSYNGEGSGKLKYYRKCENKWVLIFELITYLS